MVAEGLDCGLRMKDMPKDVLAHYVRIDEGHFTHRGQDTTQAAMFGTMRFFDSEYKASKAGLVKCLMDRDKVRWVIAVVADAERLVEKQ